MDCVAKTIQLSNAFTFSASHSRSLKSHQLARAISLNDFVGVGSLEHHLELFENGSSVLPWCRHLTEFVILVCAPEEASFREVLVSLAICADRNVVIAFKSSDFAPKLDHLKFD